MLSYACQNERAVNVRKRNTVGQESVMYSKEFFILSRRIERFIQHMYITVSINIR